MGSGPGGPFLGDEVAQLLDRPVEIVVDQRDHADLLGDEPLLLRLRQPSAELVLVVAPLAEAPLLLLERRRLDEHEEGVGVVLLHDPGAVDVDLEEDVGPGRRVGQRRALPVVEELDPLEEPTGVDQLLELLLGDEVVGVGRLTRPAGAGRP